MAGIFEVMAFAVRSLDKKDIDPAFMAKLSKIATAEMISTKVIYVVKALVVSYSLFQCVCLSFDGLIV